jgi:hypothetical protein
MSISADCGTIEARLSNSQAIGALGDQLLLADVLGDLDAERQALLEGARLLVDELARADVETEPGSKGDRVGVLVIADAGDAALTLR